MPVAMEASPEVMDKLLSGLGVDGVKAHDLLSVEDGSLSSLPGKLLGLLLTLPKEGVKGEQEGEGLYLIQQDGRNMCGTVSLIHVIANRMTESEIGDGLLGFFLKQNKTNDPELRGRSLRSDTELFDLHNEAANEGHSLPIEGEARHHIVALIESDGTSYMLDSSTGKAFKLEGDILTAARGYINSGGDSVDYSLLALMQEVKERVELVLPM